MENLSHKLTSADIITVVRTENQTSAFSGVLPTGPHFAGSLGFGAGEQGAQGSRGLRPGHSSAPGDGRTQAPAPPILSVEWRL